MTERARLHVLFTMDCLPAPGRSEPRGPTTWEQSARAIDGFCTRLFNAGYPATLFVTPACAREQAPLLEAVAESGAELGLLILPHSLGGTHYHHYLGQYRRDDQEAIVALALAQFQDALGVRPQSVRSAMFSASDETFAVLYTHGFRQGSLSSPGRRVTKHAAVWTDAPRDPHYVDPGDRRRVGGLPFLEVPATTDASQVRGGVSPDLAIENGTVDAWHRPLIQGQLGRMETETVAFRALCLLTRNTFAFERIDNPQAATLAELTALLASLEETYEIVPTTLAGAHVRFRDAARGIPPVGNL